MNKEKVECLHSSTISSLTTKEVKQFFTGMIVDNLPIAKRYYISRFTVYSYKIYSEDREYIGIIYER